MADLYRKASMDKLSNPEQLDRMIRITSPLSWLALAAVLLVVAVTVVWSVVGTLPETETVNGIVADPAHTLGIYADRSGTVTALYKKAGDAVEAGEAIAEITSGDETSTVTADMNGTLAFLSVEENATVLAGGELARLSPENAGAQVVVCYVPAAEAQKLESGMQVLVYPAAVDSQKYGHMEAEIIGVDEYAANIASMSYVLGTDNLLADQFAANGPVVAVVCRLKTDAAAKSGYYWSSAAGRSLSVQNGSIVSAKIIVDECAPITKLIGTVGGGED